MNAILPEHLVEISLQDLIVGESGWIVPWAMYAKKDGTLWLNGNYTFEKEQRGTASMRVERVAGGYSVDLNQCQDERYSLSGPCFMGDFAPLAVVEITSDGRPR